MDSYKTNQTMQGISCGYRFLPSDEELISEYLLKKVNGEALPSNAITECEIYGDKEPWKIFGNSTSQKFYVFTKLKIKGKGKGKRMERIVGCGTWKMQNTDHVKDSQKNLVGFKKLFNFVAVKSSTTPNNEVVNNGHWIMHEYSLLNNESDYVVCAIRNKHGMNVGEEDQDEPQKKRRKSKNSMDEEKSSFSQGAIPVSTAAVASNSFIEATPISVLASNEASIAAPASNSFIESTPISVLASNEALSFDDLVDMSTTTAAAPNSFTEATPMSVLASNEALSFDDLVDMSTTTAAAPNSFTEATPMSVLASDEALSFGDLVDMSFLDNISLDELLEF